MTDTVLQSFCERCGTRYTFAEPQDSKPEGGRPKRGLFGRKAGDAGNGPETGPDISTALPSSERFRGTFHFCLECRQYTCVNCWNAEAGACIGCRPPGSVQPERTSRLSVTNAARDGLTAWPSRDTAPVADTSGGGDHSETPWASAQQPGPSTPPGPKAELDEWGRPRKPEPSEAKSEPAEATPDAATPPAPAIDPWRGVVFTKDDEPDGPAGTPVRETPEGTLDFGAAGSSSAEPSAWPTSDRRVDQPRASDAVDAPQTEDDDDDGDAAASRLKELTSDVDASSWARATTARSADRTPGAVPTSDAPEAAPRPPWKGAPADAGATTGPVDTGKVDEAAATTSEHVAAPRLEATPQPEPEPELESERAAEPVPDRGPGPTPEASAPPEHPARPELTSTPALEAAWERASLPALGPAPRPTPDSTPAAGPSAPGAAPGAPTSPVEKSDAAAPSQVTAPPTPAFSFAEPEPADTPVEPSPPIPEAPPSPTPMVPHEPVADPGRNDPPPAASTGMPAPSIDVWNTPRSEGPFAQPYAAPQAPPPQAAAPPPPAPPRTEPSQSPPPPASAAGMPVRPSAEFIPPPPPPAASPSRPVPQARATARACPNCGLPLSAKAQFCRRCGSPQA